MIKFLILTEFLNKIKEKYSQINDKKSIQKMQKVNKKINKLMLIVNKSNSDIESNSKWQRD